MPQMQDIVKKSEKLTNQEKINKADAVEQAPATLEVQKTAEMPQSPEAADVTQESVAPAETATPLEVATPTSTQTITKDEELSKIEDVLEEDLEDVYFKMSPEKQAEFQKAGEVTASKISVVLKDTHVKIKKILELIRNWLKIVPGINKFFLEQEVKIKTDKILEMKEEEEESPPQEQGDENKI